ncbi:major membrane immunogen (membrane-anchored lipoprotein) [Paenibacillus sp. DS2015]|uniref:FMN-binding protein n=1 Tax=Paenibacillus sp. DS2015 TaxID=3373917 RepID=UPI003D251369
MKKKWSVLLCSLLLVGMLAGCGKEENNAAPVTTEPATTSDTTAPAAAEESGKYADGSYYAEGEFDADSGWKPYIVLTVKDGKIATADWNFVSSKGGPDKKAVDKAGNYGMKEKGGAQAEWYEQAETAEKFLIEKQDPAAITLNDEGKTDAITGVSIHVNDLANLSKKALDAGPIEPGTYKDGSYHAEGDQFDADSGWKSTVDLTVANGKIIYAFFSGVNEAGDDKQAYSIDGKYGMKEKGGSVAEWHEEAQTAQAFLIEKQDPAAITLNDEGKTDAITGVTIHVTDFVTLSQKALEGAK